MHLILLELNKYDRRKESVNKIKHRMKGLYARGKSLNNRYGNNFSYNYKDSNKSNMKSFLQTSNSKDLEAELVKYLQSDSSLAPYKNLIKSLIPMKFKDILKQALLENSRKGNFIRIYPAKGTDVYDQYFKSVRPYNVFLYKWLFSDEIIPLSIADSVWDIPSSISNQTTTTTKVSGEASSTIQNYMQKNKKPQRPQTVKVGSNPSMKTNDSDKIIITGDDVLIEYVQRIINALDIITESSLSTNITSSIEKFIHHYVWHTKDPIIENPTISLKERLLTRYEEMRQRRKRLVKSIYKREGKIDTFEPSYKKMTQQKLSVLKNFSGTKLEEMLKTSTKNVAQEVVSILINHSKDYTFGVLPDIEINVLKTESNYEEAKHLSKTQNDYNENEDGAEGDERADEDIVANQMVTSSFSHNFNKFTNPSDANCNRSSQNQPPVNFNNYFNKPNSR